MFFLYSPSAFGQVAGFAGVQTTTTISSPPNRLIVIPYGNFSFLQRLDSREGYGDVDIHDGPQGLNIFVMNQGNFTMFTKNQSALSNYILCSMHLPPASLDAD